MNDTNPPNPAVPPQIPPVGTWPASPHAPRTLPLGDDPADREPVPNLIAAIEAILRHPRRVMFQLRQPGAGKIIGAMLFGLGVVGFLTRRNLIIMFLCTEVMFQGVLINLVAMGLR